jgi:hypothetical protein
MVEHPRLNDSAPLVIGATGGSGTRVVARIAIRAGYDLGRDLNPAADALAFQTFHDVWINRFFAITRNNRSLSSAESAKMKADFEKALAQHRLGSTVADRWGWKAPRSIYLLPFLHARFPNLKFIHVIRDGRDMAFSKNRNQLRKHGRVVLTWWERNFYPSPLRSILLWQRVNLEAAEYGETQLRQSYCRVRFEDLCQQPVEIVRQLVRFLDGNVDDAAAIAREEILPPSSVGRWRNQPPHIIAKMQKAAGAGLRKFGYLS